MKDCRFFTLYYPNAMQSFQEILNLVAEAIKQVPDRQEPKGLYEPIRYVLSLGGKRIRPALMLMAYGMYRDDIESIMPTALGIETYHNYTLWTVPKCDAGNRACTVFGMTTQLS